MELQERDKIVTPRLYDLLQDWRFTPLSKREKAVVLFSQIVDEIDEIIETKVRERTGGK